MSLSRKLLELLKLLDYPEMRLDDLTEHYKSMYTLDPPFTSEEERLQDDAYRKIVQKLTSDVVKERMEPARGRLPVTLTDLIQGSGDLDGLLDAHFTTLGLQRVSGAVNRWKDLQPLRLALLPEKEVADYIRQAIECYIYGMPTAAAILCRAVLEASLEGTLGSLNVSLTRSGLQKLIDVASKVSIGSSKLLPPDLAAKASRVKGIGDKSVHEAVCSEVDAFESIRETAEVLMHLYGQRHGRKG